MKAFDLASLGNWLNTWIQPCGAIYGFHNHSVWGDNPIRWQDYTCGHATFASPYMVGLAKVLTQKYDERGKNLLEQLVLYQSSSMREDGEYKHIGFQAGELAKVGLIHNMVPTVSLLLASEIGAAFLSENVRKAAYHSALCVLTEGSLHYGNGRADQTACCNQDYTRIWAKLLLQKVYGDCRFEQEAKEDLEYMIENFHISGVPDAECDGTKRALRGKDQFMLEPAEYYGLMILPLCLGYEMFGEIRWLEAAQRLCNHVIRSSFIDDDGCRRVHRAYYSKTDGTWGKLDQPMQIQGNGITLFGIMTCERLCHRKEYETFLQEMDACMIHYQTERGFVCPATGWNTEADAAPASAWQAHDFMYFAHHLSTFPEQFWDTMFRPVNSCSAVLSGNCIWLEKGPRWTIQDYFTGGVYQIYGRKDRDKFGKDLSWTGEKNNVQPDYLWGDDLPRFVLNNGVVTPLRPLAEDIKVYNFSPYCWDEKG